MSRVIPKRDKKRPQDRNAQRATRQRTKDCLALLELQVSQLQGGADKALSDELRQMRKERDELVTIAEATKSALESSNNEAAQT
ncbi:Zinc-binding dehydrogenase family protein [Aspergillus niger]|uniref:Zinc-binding dehydrogenase family protein n=1 Tax=Aspergillus niger TaxID=5061 RepID=A0A505ILT2_ASPNG|nr:Zinc-binding dehydrogenase family protein [Aspergillus niger]